MSFENEQSGGVRIQDNRATNGHASITIRPAQPQTAQRAEVQGVRIERAEDRRATVTVQDIAPKRPGILSTARTRDGSIPTGKLTPNMLIHVTASDGKQVPMPLRMAEAEGLVRRNAAGDYEEVDAETAQRMQAAEAQEREQVQAQAEAEQNFPEPMGEDLDGFLGDLHSAMAAAGVNPDAAIIQAFNNPEAFRAQVLPRITAQGGSAEEVWEGIQSSFASTVQRVAALCEAEGVNPEAFFGFLDSGQVTRARWMAAGLQALGNQALPMRKLIREFKSIGRYETRGAAARPQTGRPGE